MKNILLATTALVASAGIASAEVALTGLAEIGIQGGDVDVIQGTAPTDETQFFTDIDVTFTMTGEADNGLTFGAAIDLDETDSDGAYHYLGINPVGSNAFYPAAQGGETYFVAFGGARLDMGDTDGAFDAALTETAIGGTLNDDHTEHAGYNGNSGLDGSYDGQIARFSYTFDAFTGHLSVEMDDADNFDPIYGLGVAYNAELAGLDLGVGLGYQTGDDDEIWGLSLSTTFNNGLQAIVNYSSRDTGGFDTEHWGIGLGYTMNALTIGVNYGEYDTDAGDSSGYGVAVNYDLGGGLVAQFGYGMSDLGNDVEFDTYSLGLAMSF